MIRSTHGNKTNYNTNLSQLSREKGIGSSVEMAAIAIVKFIEHKFNQMQVFVGCQETFDLNYLKINFVQNGKFNDVLTNVVRKLRKLGYVVSNDQYKLNVKWFKY